MIDPDFWRGKRVLVTGHTGFIGSWLCEALLLLNAELHGFALAPDTHPSLFEASCLASRMHHMCGDVTDQTEIRCFIRDVNPEIALHLAARPIVAVAASSPIATFATNVMGTAHVLDALCASEVLKSVVAVTTDKVYSNDGLGRPFREADPLGGSEPYGTSKAASEMVAMSYRAQQFQPRGVGLATLRGGNVIGGGDWAPYRLVPDLARAVAAGERVTLRMPQATRPWQHVIDMVRGCLCVAERMAADPALPMGWNIGPMDESVTVEQVAREFLVAFGREDLEPQVASSPIPDASKLALDIAQARTVLQWRPKIAQRRAVQMAADWYAAYAQGADAATLMRNQIQDAGI